jgi:hypothetical protein
MLSPAIMLRFIVFPAAVVYSVALACGTASARTASQAPVAFEVASIKANTTGEHSSSTNGNKGEVMIRNVTLKRLIEIAFQVRDYGFSGPEWLVFV